MQQSRHRGYAETFPPHSSFIHHLIPICLLHVDIPFTFFRYTKFIANETNHLKKYNIKRGAKS